ncbi:HEPN domain-containing protein [Ulvibacter litoralis]|uniref:HEPN domain-containing protein n=1 Tax=Ulvibacter litoralis TaxID=227084 RepID=UPI0015869ABA|nr:HEPN domain-containing protein [Ulvibacter litoralis]
MVSQLVQQVNVNRIYLFPPEEQGADSYYFILIIEDAAKRFKSRIKAVLARLRETYPHCSISFYSLHTLQQLTKEGNPFFLNYCRKENLVYYHHRYEEGWLFKPLDLSQFMAKARENFDIQYSRITAFRQGAAFYLEHENYAQAAFMLHQTLEQCFLAAEYFLVGDTFSGHLISDHQSYLGKLYSAFKHFFPREHKEDTHLMNTLNKAYIHSRYSLHYHIKKTQVLTLIKKADELMALVAAAVETELLKCEKLLGGDFSSVPTAPKGLDTAVAAEEPVANVANETLQAAVRLLRPRVRHEYPGDSPIHLQEVTFEVANHGELRYLISCLLRVCMLALENTQGFGSPRLSHCSDRLTIATVLELADSLQPDQQLDSYDALESLLLGREATK